MKGLKGASPTMTSSLQTTLTTQKPDKRRRNSLPELDMIMEFMKNINEELKKIKYQ